MSTLDLLVYPMAHRQEHVIIIIIRLIQTTVRILITKEHANIL